MKRGKGHMDSHKHGTAPTKPEVPTGKPSMLPDIPEDNSHCQCCRLPYNGNKAAWLAICVHCLDHCESSATCRRNRCECPGGCCVEHKPGELCDDYMKFSLALVGELVRAVCVSCAIEITKKALGA